ncbi:MAG: hypothetical protein B7Z37_10410 [Verrucomicrobia bacterium 12-59-8]|nr:MAG: hypothetical protein B7Z37_10410 [Verrucomicrobia bacterium 12-59-8]
MKDITELVAQLAALKSSPSQPTAAPGTPSPPEPPDFARSLLTPEQLRHTQITPRPRLLGEWLREGDLGYLFAPRGGGKTWLAMLIGNALAEGCLLGAWQAGEAPRRVFYFDAEMNVPDVRERAEKLGITSLNFRWLSNEHLYMDQGLSVNIAQPLHQTGLSSMLSDGSVLIIDNLSASQIGMRENENDDFDKLKEWLLSLRRRSVTVIIIHHAGRNGEMRGASRREDMAHWILSLKDATEDESRFKEFITRFSKCRNCQGRDAMPLRWALKDEGSQITVSCEAYGNLDALLAHIREGIVNATELAEMLGVQCGTVSKWARKLMNAGLVRKKGREYEAVEDGPRVGVGLD